MSGYYPGKIKHCKACGAVCTHEAPRCPTCSAAWGQSLPDAAMPFEAMHPEAAEQTSQAPSDVPQALRDVARDGLRDVAPVAQAAPQPTSGSPYVMRYVQLGRALEGPCKALLDAHGAAREKANGKKPRTSWVNNTEVIQALDAIKVAFASPEEQRRAKLKEAFERAKRLEAEGDPDAALKVLEDAQGG